MDKKFKLLFEFQKFARNQTLEETIKTVSPDFSNSLDDDTLAVITGGKTLEQILEEKHYGWENIRPDVNKRKTDKENN